MSATIWRMRPRCRGKRELDLSVDPPPDLAIEVDISRSSIDKLGIYAEMGVPEVWLYDGESLHVRRLQPSGVYLERDASDTFPFLDLKELERSLKRFDELGETAWIRSFRQWVRQQYGHLAT